jgi:uncharacterized membrane protein YqhA
MTEAQAADLLLLVQDLIDVVFIVGLFVVFGLGFMKGGQR